MASQALVKSNQLDFFKPEPAELDYRLRWAYHFLLLDHYCGKESNIHGLLFPLQAAESQLRSGRPKLTR